MSNISSYDSSSISTLFSSIGTSSSSSTSSLSSLYSSLSDYSTIKSGAYGKLLKAYYKVTSSSDSSSDTSSTKKTNSEDATSSSTSTASDSSKVLAGVESAASNLSNTAKELYGRSDNKVFTKTSSGDYDMDVITDKVSEFVENYNSLLAATGKSNTSSVIKAANSMTSLTTQKESDLSEIGITVDEDTKTLQLHEDTLKNADGDKVKSLFYGTGSYAYGVATQASMVNSYAQAEAAKSNTYTSSGTYSSNYDVGSLLSEMF